MAIEITRPVLQDVLDWLRTPPPADSPTKRPKIGHLLRVAIHPWPGQTQVLGGAHAFALAEKLEQWLRIRMAHNRKRILHIFAAAPNGFLFYLGQLSRNLGSIQLYEFAFGSRTGETYTPSLGLPPKSYEPVRPPR